MDELDEPTETAEQSWNRALGVGVGVGSSGGSRARPRPGAIKVFAAGAACFVPQLLSRARAVVGRDAACDLVVDDARMSRHHAEVRFDGKAWIARDLGSRNGTFLDGTSALTPHTGSHRSVLAVGDTLFLLVDDIRPFLAQAIDGHDGVVVGPTLGRAWRDIERAAETSRVVHLTGETGAGKELASRRFHDAGPRARGPLVTVNCAAMPATLAERLLFGARRGAYSGADAHADGYLAAAEGGTLFLDEIAELSLEVQAKLLRVVENGEILPLGAARPRRIEIGFVTATHGDLRAQVAAGQFRQDLYFRLGRPVVALPPLRDRPEDIAFLIEGALTTLTPPRRPHASLIEAALRRDWPGNVRELLRECIEAASRVPGGDSERVRAEHLDARAGRILAPAPCAPHDARADHARIREALAREHGNVSRAARVLGLHRTQLRRWITLHGVGPANRPGEHIAEHSTDPASALIMPPSVGSAFDEPSASPGEP